MKIYTYFKLICVFTLSSVMILADSNMDQLSCHMACRKKKQCSETPLGTAGFSTSNPDQWYSISTSPYPITVPLSLHRNIGSTQGHIHLTSSGLKIDAPGDYWVSFAAFLLNNQENYAALIPVFLLRNDIFDPTDTMTLSTIVSLPSGFVNVAQISGILRNVKKGTRLSLVATNGGSPDPQPITVIAWDISLFKIPCDCCPKKKKRKHSSEDH